MGTRAQVRAYRENPLAHLDRLFRQYGDVFPLPDGRVCVAEPSLARAVLSNQDGRFAEHSDFFTTAEGIFGPREAQIAIGRQSRLLVAAYLSQQADSLPGLTDRRIAPSSHWPDTGNLLVYEHVRDVLLEPATPQRLKDLVTKVVHRAVLAGARQRQSWLARAVLRARVIGGLADEVLARRKRGGEPRDVLGIIAHHSEGPETMAAEVFLSFVFALAGSTGFLIGWSLYLAQDQAGEPNVTREALRLRPIAWMFSRRPVASHDLNEMTVSPQTDVIVSTYLAQRHPRFWTDPETFCPGRWSSGVDLSAYLPFGWGAHACTGAAIATDLAEAVLRDLTGRYRLRIAETGAPQAIGPALAPPPFTVYCERR